MEKISILDKWFTYQDYDKLPNHEKCRYNSYLSMIRRLINSTNRNDKEFYTSKSDQEIKFWQITDKLLSEMRAFEIFEHSGQWFGDWSQAFFSENAGAAIEFKLPELYLALNQDYRKEYFKFAQSNNLNTYVTCKEGALIRENIASYKSTKKNQPSKKMLNASSNTDLFKIEDNKCYFLELKKREDSGGSAAKQELKDKTKKIINSIMRNDVIWYDLKKNKIRILDLLIEKKITQINIGFGIFFKKNGVIFKDSYDRRSNTFQRQLFRELKKQNKIFLSIKKKKKIQEIKINIKKGGDKSYYIPFKKPSEPIVINVEYLYGNKPFYWFIGNNFSMDKIKISEDWIDFEYTVKVCKEEREYALINNEEQYYNNFAKIIFFLKGIESNGLLNIANEILKKSKIYNKLNETNTFSLKTLDDVVFYLHLLIITNYVEIEENEIIILKNFKKIL